MVSFALNQLIAPPSKLQSQVVDMENRTFVISMLVLWMSIGRICGTLLVQWLAPESCMLGSTSQPFRNTVQEYQKCLCCVDRSCSGRDRFS